MSVHVWGVVGNCVVQLAVGEGDDGSDSSDDDIAHHGRVTPLKREVSSSTMTVPGSNKKRKVAMNLISKFVQPSFPMCETKEVVWVVDEYGASIDDLQFHDINTAQVVSRFVFLFLLILWC